MTSKNDPTIYRETFDQSVGGWWGWNGNSEGLKPLERKGGAVTSRGPWWVDYNHAPPGSGYLHMIFCLNTKGPFAENLKEVSGENRFTGEGHGRDLRKARITVDLKGEMEMRGSELVLLVQARKGDLISGWLLTGQPLSISPEGGEQTVTLTPDEAQWTCLGARHDRQDFYGYCPLEEVLRDVNTNIMLVLFPLTVVPMGPLDGDPHLLRAGKDYPLWRSKLPEGYISMDTIEIDFAAGENSVLA